MTTCEVIARRLRRVPVPRETQPRVGGNTPPPGEASFFFIVGIVYVDRFNFFRIAVGRQRITTSSLRPRISRSVPSNTCVTKIRDFAAWSYRTERVFGDDSGFSDLIRAIRFCPGILAEQSDLAPKDQKFLSAFDRRRIFPAPLGPRNRRTRRLCHLQIDRTHRSDAVEGARQVFGFNGERHRRSSSRRTSSRSR